MSVTIPVQLTHDRVLVDAEVGREDAVRDLHAAVLRGQDLRVLRYVRDIALRCQLACSSSAARETHEDVNVGLERGQVHGRVELDDDRGPAKVELGVAQHLLRPEARRVRGESSVAFG